MLGGGNLIAEIKGKISQSGTNLTERLEDNLTGNFFGVMRYIPFNKGLKQILLNGIYPYELADKLQQIDAEFWNSHIDFWPYDKDGVMDVLLDFPNATIGIEVKYLSRLSSDDDVSNEQIEVDSSIQQESIHQLARESRIVSRKGTDKDKFLIFVASEIYCMAVFQDTVNRNILDKDVQFGIISWQEILFALKSIKTGNKFEQLMIDDLIDLLTVKGFERFNDFQIKDELLVDKFLFYQFGSTMFTFNIVEKVKEELFYEFE